MVKKELYEIVEIRKGNKRGRIVRVGHFGKGDSKVEAIQIRRIMQRHFGITFNYKIRRKK